MPKYYYLIILTFLTACDSTDPKTDPLNAINSMLECSKQAAVQGQVCCFSINKNPKSELNGRYCTEYKGN